MDLFSHAPSPEETPEQPPADRRTHAVYTELNQPFEEIWEGFTAYTHLWWPNPLRTEPGAYTELAAEHLLDQNDDGENTLLAHTVHWAPADVIAIRPVETAGELYRVFPDGLSFTFEIGEAPSPSTVEVSAGLIPPADLDEDAELGVTGQVQTRVARELLESFVRFMGHPAETVTVEQI